MKHAGNAVSSAHLGRDSQETQYRPPEADSQKYEDGEPMAILRVPKERYCESVMLYGG